MIKAIFSDLDGTLLNNKHELSPLTIDTVKKIRDEGILFFIATGRSITTMRDIYNTLNLDTESISYNGGTIYDRDENRIHEILLDEEYARAFIKYSRKTGIYSHGFRDEKWYLENYNHIAEKFRERTGFEENIVNFDDFKKLNFNKYVFGIEKNELEIVRNYLNNNFGNNIYKVLSSPTEIEIMNKNVSKGKAMKFIMDQYGLDASEVMAFGDAENDIEMIKNAGHGVAMKNALRATKDATKYEAAENDNDGVAKYLIDFFKIK